MSVSSHVIVTLYSGCEARCEENPTLDKRRVTRLELLCHFIRRNIELDSNRSRVEIRFRHRELKTYVEDRTLRRLQHHFMIANVDLSIYGQLMFRFRNITTIVKIFSTRSQL